MPPATPTSIRAFIAVEINEDTRRVLAKVQDSLRQTGAHVAWVVPANLHVSLAFLGDVVSDAIPKVSRILDDAAGVARPFSFDVVELGTFGRPDSPRVLWAGVKNADPLTPLQGRIAADLTTIGIPLEKRAFVPHLTLGRVRSSRGCRELVDAIRSMKELPFGHVEAQRLVLMRSVLTPTGAEYSIVHEARLTGK